MINNNNTQERGHTNPAGSGATGAQAGGNNEVSDGRAPDDSPDGKAGTRTGNTGVTRMTPMELQMNRDLNGLLFIRLRFTMEAAHNFVFEKMMTGTNTLCRLDEKIDDHLVSVT